MFGTSPSDVAPKNYQLSIITVGFLSKTVFYCKRIKLIALLQLFFANVPPVVARALREFAPYAGLRAELDGSHVVG